ncbi:MAG: 30S ribosome-binding factor RbfA [Saprospirales bacterium]|nr:MAG: 30S ribosome-binding factor RbfA [Saprospirales bacterium]
MASKRQLQVAETIKRHFSVVLQREGYLIYGSEPLVTVTGVSITPDLSQASIYLSIYNVAKKENVIEAVSHHGTKLRQSLASRVRKHMRRVPFLEFHLDELLDEMEKVDNLFERLYAEDQMGEEE